MASDNGKNVQKLFEELQDYIKRYEIAEQNMRNMRSKLDIQVDLSTRIHQYSQQAFQIKNLDELYPLIAEGIVDIFQVEIGVILGLDIAGESLTVLGACNLDPNIKSIKSTKERMARRELWDFSRKMAVWESPVNEDSVWAQLDLSKAIYMPLFNNKRELEGVMLGGISKKSEKFYDFDPNESIFLFMVYCQQMNGIYNNHIAIQAAHEADNAKSRFLANLSHEIRTPMNAIIGMVQIGQNESSNEELKRCLNQIGVSSRHLLGLINDVLDISKIEEGKLVLGSDPFELDKTVESILASTRQSAVQKKQALTVNYNKINSYAYCGDSMRLSQVLINLLSNAVKFTPEGGHICLGIEELVRNGDKALLKFSVKDDGIGIKEEYKERIFAPFEQGDGSTSRKYGGTGLGLAISQRIIELMGGTIELQSKEDEGTNFYFSVWLKADNPKEEPEAADKPLDDYDSLDFAGRKILVVDDVDINREIIYALLKRTGLQFDGAVNGQEAVEKFTGSAVNEYAAVLMDIQMPVMDGYDATRAIRNADRADAKTVPIIAMTANVFKEDVQNVLAAGMNGHIGKPIEYNTLAKALSRAFKK